MLQYGLGDEPEGHPQQSTSVISKSSSIITALPITLSAEGQAKLLEVAQDLRGFVSRFAVPLDSHRMLTRLISDELSKGVLEIPKNNFSNRELRKMLSHRFSTTSIVPVPMSLEAQEQSELGMLLCGFVLLKTPFDSLSPRLQIVKRTIVVGAVEVEQEHRAQQLAELQKIKDEVNELLRSNDEPEFPFASIYAAPGQTPGQINLKFGLEYPLNRLPERKPEVWEAVNELLSVHSEKGIEVQGYFKRAP